VSQITVRPAVSSDLDPLAALEHGYSTDYVWQMDARDETGLVSVSFRQVHLPRSMRVTWPRDPQQLAAEWARRVCFLVAEDAGQRLGYLNLTRGPSAGTGWIADLAVERRLRRTGVGSVLLASAAEWARGNGMQRLILETQTKNYPAICFAQKNGFAFCGYNDRYYANQDVALFFGLLLK
jgi:GNAT superfamily N-acetyltransferase